MVPSVLDEVISVTPAMCPNWRSSGVAIDEAMMSGLAPGRVAATVMVGKSTWGRGATGRTMNAIMPAMATATVRSVVATGRSIKRREGFMRAPPGPGGWSHPVPWCYLAGALGEAGTEIVKEDIDDRRGVEREDLAEEQAADHGDAEGLAELRTDAGAEGQGQAAEQCGHGGHHDGAEAEERCLVDGFGGVLAFFAFGLEGEIHHHDAVLLDDADEQDDANDGHDIEIEMEETQGKQRADTG